MDFPRGEYRRRCYRVLEFLPGRGFAGKDCRCFRLTKDDGERYDFDHFVLRRDERGGEEAARWHTGHRRATYWALTRDELSAQQLLLDQVLRWPPPRRGCPAYDPHIAPRLHREVLRLHRPGAQEPDGPDRLSGAGQHHSGCGLPPSSGPAHPRVGGGARRSGGTRALVGGAAHRARASMVRWMT